MTVDIDAFARRLRPHYGAFLRPGRALLTGHSHQAWPDVARDAMALAFDDAADHVDDKWGHAFAHAARVRRGVAERLGAHPDNVALGPSTHDLLLRFLSALDLRRRPRIVSTLGEFHSMHRQLSRLAEEGVDVTWVPAEPASTLAERVAAAVDGRTAAVLMSTVLFETSAVVQGLDAVAERAAACGAAALFDAYHAFQVLPFTLSDFGKHPVFVVAGGYKYAQWGEGACFLVVPAGTPWRPVVTGWFSDFAHLGAARNGGPVTYGATGAERFAGSTYDPTSHYRAGAVLDFFERKGMTPEHLRAVSLAQTRHLLDRLGDLDVRTPRAERDRAGFLSVRVPDAEGTVAALRAEGIYVDARGDVVRLGPAPYTTTEELDAAAGALCRVARRPTG